MVLKFETDNTTKAFEVHAAGLPRYLYTQFESEIDQVQLVLDGNQEKKLSETYRLFTLLGGLKSMILYVYWKRLACFNRVEVL